MTSEQIASLVLETMNSLEFLSNAFTKEDVVEICSRFLATVRQEESKEAVAEVHIGQGLGLCIKFKGRLLPPGTKLFLHPPVDRSGEAVAWMYEYEYDLNEDKQGHWPEDMRKRVAFSRTKPDAYASPLFLHPQEVEGMCLVPCEPTNEMCEQAYYEFNAEQKDFDAANLWRVMSQAAKENK